jgi:hypothetical protein
MIMMRAVDRNDSTIIQEPLWLFNNSANLKNSLLFLDLPYKDFILAAAANSTSGFFLRDLWTGAAVLGSMGYIPEIFYTEFVRAVYMPSLFLSLCIFALMAGWKYRSRRKVPYTLFPMLFVLPVVFQTIVLFIDRVFNLVSIWTVLSFGFIQALVICFVSTFLFFLTALFLLASQREGEK